MPNHTFPAFVYSNNLVFGNKCIMAKDAPNLNDNEELVLDFPPEANVSEITTLSIHLILDQTDTHFVDDFNKVE